VQFDMIRVKQNGVVVPQSVWLCPWEICTHEQAQECRAMMGNTKRKRGCGSYFPAGTTTLEAKIHIGRAADPNAKKPTDSRGPAFPG
jgi:hypothetical protein